MTEITDAEVREVQWSSDYVGISANRAAWEKVQQLGLRLQRHEVAALVWAAHQAAEAVRQEDAALPTRDERGHVEVTCGSCGGESGTNCDDDDIRCGECDASRCPHCGGWFGGE